MLSRLIREAHRRSLWQVLAVYLAASWAALQVAEAVTDSAGLPAWVPGFALVLLILGLPIVLATAFVQEGLPTREASEARDAADAAVERASEPVRGTHHRLFTWRNAALGGGAALALLGVAVAAYFLMRVTGFGPVASLAAQGVFEQREPVVLAEFANTTGDATLARMVTEALRIDLHESSAVSVLPAAYVEDALRRMGRATDASLTAQLAREIALRDGVKAVMLGEVGAVGSGYVVTASILDATGGTVLGAFRETASGPNDLLAAIDRLSSRIRERAGESLRSIRKGEPLSRVTTSSLDALRAYTNALERSSAGDREGAVRMLETAIELDPEFAMAHRKLAVELNNMNLEPTRVRDAARRAYELRTRLTNTERLLAEAYYFSIAGERERAADAYRQALLLKPDEIVALTNLSNLLYASRADSEEGLALLQRAANSPAANVPVYNNLALRLWHLRRDAELDTVLTKFEQRYPDTHLAARLRPLFLLMKREFQASHDMSEELLARFSAARAAQFNFTILLSAADAGRGRLNEARRHLEEARRIAAQAGQSTWSAESGVRLLWLETFGAMDPARARTALRRIDHEVSSRADDFRSWDLATAIVSAALLGDAPTTTRLQAALDAQGTPALRNDAFEFSQQWVRWGRALAAHDGATARDAITQLSSELFGHCDGRRCWGDYELGLAYDELHDVDGAIAAYERHMIGLPTSESFWDAVATPRVILRLAELYEQQGNAARAAEYYTRYTEMWKDADAELQPRVRAARDRAAALLARRG